MEAIVESLQNQSHRDSTRANYHRIWKAFNKFYIQLDQKPKPWDDRIMLYVAYLIDTNHRPATIKSYVLAIRAVLKNLGVCLVKDNAVLASLLRACRLKNNQIQTRLPIRKGLMQILISSVDRLFQPQSS